MSTMNRTPFIIHSDQTVFIKGSHSPNNLHRLFNSIHHKSQTNIPMVIFPLDREKACEKLSGITAVTATVFCFEHSKHLALVNHLFTGKSILYTSPMTTATTNGITSHNPPCTRVQGKGAQFAHFHLLFL